MNPDSSLGLYLTASNEEECGVVADTTTNMTIKIRCHQRSLHPKRLRLNRSVKNLFRGILTGCRIIKIKISSPTSNILVSLLLALTSKTIKGGFLNIGGEVRKFLDLKRPTAVKETMQWWLGSSFGRDFYKNSVRGDMQTLKI